MSEIPDYESAYRDLRIRVTDLLRSAEPNALDNMGAIEAGRELLVRVNQPNVVNDWTDAQVAKRAEWPIDQVLDDWAEHAARIEPGMNALHPAIGQMVADAVTHEHDIRGGLGTPGARESAAMVTAVNWALRLLGMRLEAEGLGTLLIEHEGGVVELGSGEPVTRLVTTRFEIARVVTGRRSMKQIHEMRWDGPLDPGVLVLAPELLTPRPTDLVE
jgi:hypothetical protein